MHIKVPSGVLLVLWGFFCLMKSQYAMAADKWPNLQDRVIARIPQSSPMPDSQTPASDPPPGYIGFCLRDEAECRTPPNEPPRVTMSPLLWTILQRVNIAVNHFIRPLSDFKHYGRNEYWTIPRDGLGDCEDYALAKRAALASIAIPRSALRIALVQTQFGEKHAVLTLATDRGDYVLDNLSDEIRSWKDIDYKWIERQDPISKTGWIVFDSARDHVITSARNSK